MPKLSFIIPTFKNTHSLFKCVETIVDICVTDRYAYEVIVIDNYLDNKYTQGITEVLYPNITVLKNPVIGAHHSRCLGVYNCGGEILVFVDDDNYLTAAYIQFIVQTYEQDAGDIFIGTASVAFRPIDWKDVKYSSYVFACGSLQHFQFKDNIPVYWGAGMAMNRSLALSIFSDQLIVEGRMDKKTYIMSGEDHEISLRAYQKGASPYYYTGTGLLHDFNTDRLNDDYYAKVLTGFSYAAWLLRIYYLFQNRSFAVKSFGIFYIFNLLRAMVSFIFYPLQLDRRIILLDAFSFNKKRKEYKIAYKYRPDKQRLFKNEFTFIKTTA